jgi:hypothetical protein
MDPIREGIIRTLPLAEGTESPLVEVLEVTWLLQLLECVGKGTGMIRCVMAVGIR